MFFDFRFIGRSDFPLSRGLHTAAGGPADRGGRSCASPAAPRSVDTVFIILLFLLLCVNLFIFPGFAHNISSDNGLFHPPGFGCCTAVGASIRRRRGISALTCRRLTVAPTTVYQLKLYLIAHVTPHPPQCAHWGTFSSEEKAERPRFHWLLL